MYLCHMNEENVFILSEQQETMRPPGNGNNCNGHKNAIRAGGHGHWVGDSCGCDGGGSPNAPTTSISSDIGLLFVVALILILKFSRIK